MTEKNKNKGAWVFFFFLRNDHDILAHATYHLNKIHISQIFIYAQIW